MATPSPPLSASFRSRSRSSGSEAGNSSLEETPEALVALAAAAGYLSPTIPMESPGSRPPKRSRSSFSSSSGNITPIQLDTPPIEELMPRASLRSCAGRLVLGVKTLRREGGDAVDIAFRLADRNCIPRSLLSKLELAACSPASSLPEYLRPFCTSLSVHGSPLDCFIEEDMEPNLDQRRKGSRLCAASEGMISLADFCHASGGIARLQRDGEVTIDFRS